MNKLIDAIEALKRGELPYLSDFENGCVDGTNDAIDNCIALVKEHHKGQMLIDIKLATNIVGDIEVTSDVFKFHMPASVDRLKAMLETQGDEG